MLAKETHTHSEFKAIPRNQNMHDSIAELDRRTRDMWDEIQDLQYKQDNDYEGLRSAMDQMRTDLQNHIGMLRDADRRIAISGIRLEVAGLFVVAAGICLQGTGTLIA